MLFYWDKLHKDDLPHIPLEQSVYAEKDQIILYICVCVHMYIYINIYIYTCIHIHLYTHKYIYIHTHTQLYVHTHTHTYTHTHAHRQLTAQTSLNNLCGFGKAGTSRLSWSRVCIHGGRLHRSELTKVPSLLGQGRAVTCVRMYAFMYVHEYEGICV